MRGLILAAALALAGCGEPELTWRHADPRTSNQASFDRDWYQCTRESTQQVYSAIGLVGSSSPYVDRDMRFYCMRAKGWAAYKK